MRLDNFKAMKRAAELELGTHKVVFEKIQYRTDDVGEVTGAFIHVRGFRSLFIPIFETENYQLDLLLAQLGCDSYDDAEINKFAGKEITCTRYQRETYTNVSFNPNPREVEEFA